MALLFFDGFEYADNSEMTNGSSGWGLYVAAGVASSYGRFSTGGLMTYQDGGAGARLTISSKTTLIAGCAMYDLNTISAGSGRFFGFRDSAGYNHVFLNRNTSTKDIEVYCGTTFLGSVGYTFPVATWFYVELKATIHDTTGSVEVRINGETKLALTNVDTNAGGTGIINEVVLGAPPSTESFRKYHDDFYVCDTSGSLNNDFLSDVKVVRLKPNAAGDSTQFTPLSGSNYTNVDELTPDSDTSYVYSSTAGNKDLYNVESLASAPANIYGVRVTSTMRKDDAGSLTARNVLKSGATTSNGTTVGPLTSYAAFWDYHETDPNTSAAWTNSALDSLQVGVEQVS